MTLGYFAYWTLKSFLIDDKDHRRTRKLTEVEKWPVKRNNYFASSHASHQYTPRGRRQNCAHSSKYKNVSLGHPQLALAAQTTSKLWWDNQGPTACNPLHQLKG